MSVTDATTALIANSRGPGAASSFQAFKITEADKAQMAEVGCNLLKVFPKRPGACIVMSALYALGIRKAAPHVPTYVIAGDLFVGESRVFGDDSDVNGEVRFSHSHPSWDGHAWLVAGDFLADVSIFRTAYSPKSPPLLAAHVTKEFGTGRGLFISPIETTGQSGLVYVPKYVLTEEQLEALARGALALIETH